MSKLNEALGYIEDKYLIEADENSGARRKPKLKFVPLIAACAVLLAVGAAAIGIRYFAPGVGIVDGGIRVLAARDSVRLGDIVIESVMLSDLGDSAELSCWVYRENEIMLTPEMISSGETPAELTALRVIVDGREYSYTDASLSTVGFSYYNFSGIPVCEELTLSYLGEEARITLSEASASDYAFISFGRDSLTLIPVSAEKGLYQVELRDDFAAEIAKAADQSSVYAYFAAKDSDGNLSFLDGSAMLFGVDCDSLSGVRPENPAELSEVALLYVDYSFSFWGQSGLPEVKAKLPAEGETIGCSGALFETDGLRIDAVSVQRNKNGLYIETSFEGGDKFPAELISGFSADARAYVRREDGLHEVCWSDGLPVYRDYESNVDIGLSKGDEIVLRLDSIWMMYCADGTSKTAIEPNLGSAKLKS